MTLIELIISFGIFAIICAFMIMGFRDVRKHDELRESAQELASNLRLAQNLAMTGQKAGGSVPIGGYGIHINRFITVNNPGEQYKIFADFASINSAGNCVAGANERFDNDLDLPNTCESAANRDVVVFNPTYSLKNNVKFYKITISDVPPAGPPLLDIGYLDITFKPPKPVPFVGYDMVSGGRDSSDPLYSTYTQSGRTVEIFLKHATTNQCRKVTIIGPSGQISEEFATCP